MTSEFEIKLRQYAAGDLAWQTLEREGLTYGQVLSGLGTLGLRPPIARPDGPNAAALIRGRMLIRKALAHIGH